AQIAWGGTNMMADTQDLFFERADASGANYEADGVWQPFQVRSEVFNVRADFPEKLRRQYAPVTLQVRSSRHGPIISDHFKVFDQPVALRWTSLDAADTSYEAFFRMNYARDWSEFKQALSHHVAPAMNMLYADRAGNIGYLGAGRIPVRSRGEGTTPSPGWDSSYGW
ncbi:penicillin acylase family protein, partial [Lysobacter sp. 2RAB21]